MSRRFVFRRALTWVVRLLVCAVGPTAEAGCQTRAVHEGAREPTTVRSEREHIGEGGEEVGVSSAREPAAEVDWSQVELFAGAGAFSSGGWVRIDEYGVLEVRSVEGERLTRCLEGRVPRDELARLHAQAASLKLLGERFSEVQPPDLVCDGHRSVSLKFKSKETVLVAPCTTKLTAHSVDLLGRMAELETLLAGAAEQHGAPCTFEYSVTALNKGCTAQPVFSFGKAGQGDPAPVRRALAMPGERVLVEDIAEVLPYYYRLTRMSQDECLLLEIDSYVGEQQVDVRWRFFEAFPKFQQCAECARAVVQGELVEAARHYGACEYQDLANRCAEEAEARAPTLVRAPVVNACEVAKEQVSGARMLGLDVRELVGVEQLCEGLDSR